MITVRLNPTNKSPQPYFKVTRIAGQSLCWDVDFEVLQPFSRILKKPTPIEDTAPPPTYDPSQGELIYQGPGWLGNQWRRVSCIKIQNGYVLDVHGVAVLWVELHGQSIRLLEHHVAVSSPIMAETVLGPALVLALALHNIWCLHASASLYKGKLVAFLGDSGVGKSTLATFLNTPNSEHWQRVADDLLPLSIRTSHILAHPRFPQLKLPAEKQPSLHVAEDMPIQAIFFLDYQAGESAKFLSFERLPPEQSLLKIVHFTAGAKLFDSLLLRLHLEACAQIAERVPVFSLKYFHSQDFLRILRQESESLLISM